MICIELIFAHHMYFPLLHWWLLEVGEACFSPGKAFSSWKVLGADICCRIRRPTHLRHVRWDSSLNWELVYRTVHPVQILPNNSSYVRTRIIWPIVILKSITSCSRTSVMYCQEDIPYKDQLCTCFRNNSHPNKNRLNAK